jgi:hypothetical protein
MRRPRDRRIRPGNKWWHETRCRVDRFVMRTRPSPIRIGSITGPSGSVATVASQLDPPGISTVTGPPGMISIGSVTSRSGLIRIGIGSRLLGPIGIGTVVCGSGVVGLCTGVGSLGPVGVVRVVGVTRRALCVDTALGAGLGLWSFSMRRGIVVDGGGLGLVVAGRGGVFGPSCTVGFGVVGDAGVGVDRGVRRVR